ncbi:MAG TPA: hypothetical protein PKG88_01095 [Bacteroidales bacterium]|jgi:hypothetical protein|nr:hypothetical protein [Bacteroidales bacterium]HPS71565.1 hypothetical protein [Bacteroidales bacterium]
MELFDTIMGFVFIFFGVICIALIIYLIIKRAHKKEDFENRDN